MKKLFSYLLISSMVVLSSCTNYDDQFDDLNSQINSLKGQIEGFSSLSSGLTALQGTVASLQSAVANIPVTPATDISGLESTQATLTAALTALAADVKALQDTLANAATAAEVAALQTALAAAQSDLTELLASNNVYSEEVIINSESSLSVYEALGDKLTIVNADVTITQSLTNGVDAARLQAVVDKMVTVTKDITYTHSGAGVTAVNFSALTGVATMTLNQEAPISLPSLVSAGNIKVTKNNKVTSFSAPALTSVMSFNTGTANELDLSASATSIDLSALVNVTSGALTVETKSTGTIDLTALSPIVATTGKANTNFSLKTAGAKSIALPGYIDGTLETDAEVVTLVAFKNAPTFTGTNNLEELHMHAVEADLTNALKDETNISILDIIGVVPTTGSTEVVKGDSPVGIKITDASELTSLTLAGNIGVVDLDSATNLTSVTTSGAILSFKLDNATDLTELTLGHGPSSTSTYKRSDLVITGATSLESLTADSVNNANTLTITGNTSLETISLAGLKAVATAKTAMKPRVTISGNALDISSFQLPSTVDTTPVVDGKITTTSGVDGLQAYLDKAIAATGSIVTVIYDDVAQIVDAEGEVYTEDTDTTSVSVTYATSKSVTVTAGSTFTLVNVSPGNQVTSAGVKQRNTAFFADADAAILANDNVFTFNAGGVGESALTVTNTAGFRGAIADFESTDISTWLPEVVTAMQAKIDAAGYDYTLTAANDYGATAAYTVNLLSTSGSADNSAISASGVVFVKVGTSYFVTETVSAGTQASLLTAIESAINNGKLSGTFTASVVGTTVKLEKKKSYANQTKDLAYTAYPDMSFGNYTTSTSTSAVPMSYTLVSNKAITKGWRVTAVNDSYTVKADNLEADGVFLSASTANNITVTSVGADGQYENTTSTLQVGWDLVEEPVTTGDPATTTDFTAWM